MVMMGYYTLPKTPELQLHCHMQFSVIPRTPLFEEDLNPSAGSTVSKF